MRSEADRSYIRHTRFSSSLVTADDSARLYLDLLKGCLTRSLFGERYRALQRPVVVGKRRRPLWAAHSLLRKLLGRWDLELVERVHFDPAQCEEGGRWPAEAETMVGLRRLDNIEGCVRAVIQDGIPGDLIETGVWRGGAAIFMLAALRAYGDISRQVWLADSFSGLPKPDVANYPQDAGDIHWTFASVLSVSLDEVRANVARDGLLDERVRFLPGWFSETLPHAPISALAVLRLDGDMYGSTMDALRNLYPKLSPGGFCIVDDYALRGCRQAVDDYRTEQQIAEPLVKVDHSAVFWRRSQ